MVRKENIRLNTDLFFFMIQILTNMVLLHFKFRN